MNATKNWIERYIDRTFTVEEIEQGLTQAGIEVEGSHDLSRAFSGVVVGQVVTCDPHPSADRLSLCKVDAGTGELLQIICGAPNCRAGMKTPVARVGAVLPGGFKIKKAKLKGIESHGMLCSAQELGIEASLIAERDRDGIWELSDRAEVGQDLKQAIGFDDVVFELGITPNRADCFGMLNVARELAMMYREKPDIPCVTQDQSEPDAKAQATVRIDDETLCNRYIARIVRKVSIGPSPDWMQNLLRASGVRPINNIVDVTNFVMLETGQPLHAFDYDKLAGHEVVVRCARQGERLITLDAVERTLDESMIIIADAEKPVAIAGVMGGANSEVDEHTTTILFESAHFDYAHVRNTSRRLGLRSEASGRFERGVAPVGSLYAINRAVDLVESMQAGARVPGAVDAYPVQQTKHRIELDPDRVNATLGTDIPATEMLGYFVRLGFGVEKMQESNRAVIDVPYYRMDITRHVDLIEEVARIYGYGNVPTTLPVSATNTKRQKPAITLKERVQGILASMGMQEIISYAFGHPAEFERIRKREWLPSAVRVLNPLSEAQSVMRTSLLPGILNAARNNIRKHQTRLGLFEIGRVFTADPQGELPKETTQLSLLLTGEAKKHWYGEEQPIDFFTLKGVVETLAGRIHLDAIRFEAHSDDATFHPGRCARILLDGQVIGVMGELHPLVQEAYDLNDRTYACELTLDALLGCVTHVPQYHALPKYPAVSRDIAFTIDQEVEDAVIMDVIAEASSDKVVDYRLFDVYNGEQIEEGYKSLAYSLTYQDPERTMTDEEVSAIHEAIRDNLENKLGAKLR